MLTVLLFFGSTLAQESSSIHTQRDSLISAMDSFFHDNPDYVLNTLDSLLTLKDNDSITMARIHRGLGSVYKAKSDYSKSFDYMISALKYLRTTESSILHGSICNNIGSIYASFDLDKEALDYFSKSKSHYEKNISHDTNNDYCYVLLNISGAKTFQKKYHEALDYIEKSQQHLEKDTLISQPSKKIRLAITGIEKANNLLMLNQLDSAKSIALRNNKVLEKFNVLYPMCIGYTYLARIHRKKGDYHAALMFTKKADSVEQIFDSQETKRDVAFLYARIYEKLNDPIRSYSYLKLGKEIDDNLFSTKETAAIYRLRRDIEINEEERKLTLLKKDKEISEAKLLLYSICAFAVFGFAFLTIAYQRKKYKKEKEITRLELERATSNLDFKKRELTTAALQIIENGEKIKGFQKNIALLKEDIDSKYHSKLNSLSASMNYNTEKNWSAFKNSFEQVNISFFENIKEAYPDLTPNDLKLCSFLKLNFNSKDISNLMGISPESVRISRYRLRRKMGLTREENLTNHISKF